MLTCSWQEQPSTLQHTIDIYIQRNDTVFVFLLLGSEGSELSFFAREFSDVSADHTVPPEQKGLLRRRAAGYSYLSILIYSDGR